VTDSLARWSNTQGSTVGPSALKQSSLPSLKPCNVLVLAALPELRVCSEAICAGVFLALLSQGCPVNVLWHGPAALNRLGCSQQIQENRRGHSTQG
jgi:hypothetical protein